MQKSEMIKLVSDIEMNRDIVSIAVPEYHSNKCIGYLGELLSYANGDEMARTPEQMLYIARAVRTLADRLDGAACAMRALGLTSNPLFAQITIAERGLMRASQEIVNVAELGAE